MNTSESSQRKSAHFSRRDFIRVSGQGALAAAATAVWGCKASSTPGALGATGPSYAKLPFNRNWLFGGEYEPGSLDSGFDDSSFTPIAVPHCVADLSWHHWDPLSWRKLWVYRRHFTMPSTYEGMRVFVVFEGVMKGVTPAINGHKLPQHLGGYLPARYELSEWVKPGENVLAVQVDSRPNNVPPGSPDGKARVDYLEPGGIHRSVHLEVVPQQYIQDVFAKPVKVLEAERRVEVTLTVDAALPVQKSVEIRLELKDGDRVVARGNQQVRVEKSGLSQYQLSLSKLGDIQFWDVDAPHLYGVTAALLIGGKPTHEYHTRIGFREARFELDGFYLNGRKLRLFGLNRHELYPYVGGAMPERVVRRDAHILKHDFNCNVVRCSHYPQTPAFLDACDELGLMVWEEVPGWQYIGDEEWKELLVRDVHDMVVRDRNRPSVVIWGTRVNESRSDEHLYRRTRQMANALDGTRPTSGSMHHITRENWKEEWNEDVFAYDDYHADPIGSVGILDPVEGEPYMLAEVVGQFNYSTGKNFDSYYRRAGEVAAQQLQALRHAQAHSKAAAHPRNCGTIAWCGFEYGSLVNAHNTVKHPGVADIFRIPKLGASFYLAQVSPDVRLVIEPNFYWDFGPETPRGPGKRVAIFSNCERLEVFVDNTHKASLNPDFTGFPNLDYPPFFVDLDLDSTGHPELRIEGYLENRKVLTRNFSSNAAQDQFEVSLDDATIIGDGIDATRLTFRVVDKFGAPRALAGGEVSFDIDGPAVLVGDNPFDLTECGGAGAIWIKSVPGQSGRVTVVASHASLGDKRMEMDVVAPPPLAL